MLSGQYYMLYQTLCMFSHSSRTSSQMCEFPIPCALLHTLDFAGFCTVLKTSNTLSLLFSPEDHGIHHFPFFQTRSNPGQEKAAVDFAFWRMFYFLVCPESFTIVFLPKNIQISLILVKYNVSYNVPWYFKMSIYVTKIIKISQWSILYVALFSVKIWVFNDLSMIALCFYLHFAQPL